MAIAPLNIGRHEVVEVAVTSGSPNHNSKPRHRLVEQHAEARHYAVAARARGQESGFEWHIDDVADDRRVRQAVEIESSSGWPCMPSEVVLTRRSTSARGSRGIVPSERGDACQNRGEDLWRAPACGWRPRRGAPRRKAPAMARAAPPAPSTMTLPPSPQSGRAATILAMKPSPSVVVPQSSPSREYRVDDAEAPGRFIGNVDKAEHASLCGNVTLQPT